MHALLWLQSVANFYSRGRCSHKIFVLAYFVLKPYFCFFVNHNHNKYKEKIVILQAIGVI